MNWIIPSLRSFTPSNGSYTSPLKFEYIAFIVKSLLLASISQSGINWTSACLPSVLTSFLNVVISNLKSFIKTVIVPCEIPVSRNFILFLTKIFLISLG